MADRRSGVPVCRYYLQGHCAYGNKCRYDHPPKAKPKAKPAARPPAFPRPTPSTTAAATAASHTSFQAHSSAATAAAATAAGSGRSAGQSASWADAAPFVPGAAASGSASASAAGVSYAARLAHNAPLSNVVISRSAASGGGDGGAVADGAGGLLSRYRRGEVQLCPIALATGGCLDRQCAYLHGEPCPCCGCLALVPGDKRQNDMHVDECVAKLEQRYKVRGKTVNACCLALRV